MPIAYEVNHAARLRVIRYWGALVSADLQQLGDAIRQPGGFDPSYAGFLVFKPGVSVSGLDALDFCDLDAAISDAFSASGTRGTLRIAAITSSDCVRHEMRMWREITKSSPDYRYEYELFETVEDAAAWHGLPAGSAQLVETGRGFVSLLRAAA